MKQELEILKETLEGLAQLNQSTLETRQLSDYTKGYFEGEKATHEWIAKKIQSILTLED